MSSIRQPQYSLTPTPLANGGTETPSWLRNVRIGRKLSEKEAAMVRLVGFCCHLAVTALLYWLPKKQKCIGLQALQTQKEKERKRERGGGGISSGKDGAEGLGRDRMPLQCHSLSEGVWASRSPPLHDVIRGTHSYAVPLPLARICAVEFSRS